MTAITIQKTTAGRNLFRDSVRGIIQPTITYFALGTGTTMPTTSDTKLVNEVFRKTVTSYTSGADGVMYVNVYISPLDAVGLTIGEIGVYGSKSASSQRNSGVLIGRGLWTLTNKSNLQSFQLQLMMTF